MAGGRGRRRRRRRRRSRRGSPTARGSASRPRTASREPSGRRGGSTASTTKPRGRTKTPTSANAYSAIMNSGSTTLRAVSCHVPAPGRPSVSRTLGCHSRIVACPARRSFSPGCSRQKSMTLSRKKRICAHSSTVDHTACPAVDRACVLRARRRAGIRRDVVDPPAAGEDAVRVEVVGLPQRSRVRRDRRAPDGDTVSGDPRHEHQRRRRADEQERGETMLGEAEPHHEPDAEHERKQEQPRVSEDGEAEDAAERGRPPEGATALGRNQCDEDDRGGEQLVEDLAVQVHVVPDEVRVERREQRSAERDALGGDSHSDRVDEPGGADRDDDLSSSDQLPRAVDPEDRDEEESVERLGVRRRDAGDEAVGAAREERLREVVALVPVRGEDRVALVQQGRDPWQRCGECEHDVGMAVQSAHGEPGTVRGRLVPR